MGFRANYKAMADAIIARTSVNLTGSVMRNSETSASEREAVADAKKIVAKHISGIIGSKGQWSKSIAAGMFPATYDEKSGRAEISLPNKYLQRNSLGRRYFGRNAIHNIVILIANGYATKLVQRRKRRYRWKRTQKWKGTHRAVWGVWRGVHIRSLAQRPSYVRVNYNPTGVYKDPNDKDSVGMPKFKSLEDNGYTLGHMLDEIEAAVRARKLSAVITLSDDFAKKLATGERRVRTTLYNPSSSTSP